MAITMTLVSIAFYVLLECFSYLLHRYNCTVAETYIIETRFHVIRCSFLKISKHNIMLMFASQLLGLLIQVCLYDNDTLYRKYSE